MDFTLTGIAHFQKKQISKGNENDAQMHFV